MQVSLLRTVVSVLAALGVVVNAGPTPAGMTRQESDVLGFVQARLHRTFSERPRYKGAPKGYKHFRESILGNHFDARFTDRAMIDAEKQVHLVDLTRSYISAMDAIGVRTWLMHGTLLGWWWNQKVLPWDLDVDFQVTYADLRYLASHFNMTLHLFQRPGADDGRAYLLEVNPLWVNPSTEDTLNVIDARWIDVRTGLYIDITAVRPNRTAQALGVHGAIMCKDGHHYLAQDIFPLRVSVFEAVAVQIPFASQKLLEEEYGPRALTQTVFNGHRFDEQTKTWIKIRPRPHDLIEYAQAPPRTPAGILQIHM